MPSPRLTDQVASQLSDRLRRGEWKPGERLPTEHQLSAEFGVSRPTVRSALSRLESLGLTITRHGLGTFATPAHAEIRADLRRLESLSATIRASGLDAQMIYRSRRARAATSEERERLELPERSQVVATNRSLTASGELVAFSYDVIDRRVLPTDFEVSSLTGSLFEALARHGIEVATAVTEIHAAAGGNVGWGKRPRNAAYVLLSQVHYQDNARPVMFNRTYFIEGKFTFSLVRAR
ncbi:MAG TPA: GntR family transcriptional regulator [Acidimicrobiia bacterium]|nr:GntR family transcriptional regulator [Acidimicrobiia bacterium]